MQLRILCNLAVGCSVLCLVGVSASVAEETVSFSTASFNAIQDRLSDVETRLASLGGPGTVAHEEGECDCGWCGTCTEPGLTFSADLLFLRAYSGDQGQADSTQYLATPRATLGYVRDGGLGIRARAFVYDADTADEDFDVSYGDVEITDKIQLGCWQGLLSGGFRGAHYKESYSGDIDFTGWGPVIGAELARPWIGNLYLLGAARYSVVFGRDSVYDERETNSIAEVQLGTEYRRSLCGSTQAFLRSTWEAQYWGQVADDDEEDFGLVGFGVALGITR